MSRWSNAIKEVVTAPRHRPPNRTSQWAHRRRRREQEARSLSPATEPPADPTQPAEGWDRPSNHRASGYARQAARAKVLQKLYQANPGACMRRLLDNTPLVFCNIGEQELVAHYTATLAEPPPLGPPPAWLFPDRHPGDTEVPGATDEGDVLQTPVTPEEVVTQFKRTKRTAPGVDGITYMSWSEHQDPKSVVTLHGHPHPQGGDVTSVRNWRPIKLYSAIIARRIATWAMETKAFSPAQKDFLAYDGCAEHNFLLRSVMLEARRSKRNLLLAWLDLRDAFGSVPHDLILLMMGRLGLSGSTLATVPP
ncbi:hypothetical protein EMCRGX_G005468 [Ephydatia muelleri]